MPEEEKPRYSCCLGEEIEANTVTEPGVARTLYTYFHTDGVAAGFEWVEPDSEVPWHHHESSEEIIFCTHGQGMAYVADTTRAMAPGLMLHLPRGTRHKFKNTSSTQRLGFTWTLVPPVRARNFMPGLARAAARL
eukprot:TRINITY_DN48254_c0_g1_i1.p2 TRINITY_DN48254_c0_g1~~TRINITY_DN48254_c0_g1_i1.p2  ORF type:complete len:157 (+),score=36.66 TRINITY_DN48254_c0_g1_i1:67-471(+)